MFADFYPENWKPIVLCLKEECSKKDTVRQRIWNCNISAAGCTWFFSVLSVNLLYYIELWNYIYLLLYLLKLWKSLVQELLHKITGLMGKSGFAVWLKDTSVVGQNSSQLIEISQDAWISKRGLICLWYLSVGSFLSFHSIFLQYLKWYYFNKCFINITRFLYGYDCITFISTIQTMQSSFWEKTIPLTKA